jgi:hypothetical protein
VIAGEIRKSSNENNPRARRHQRLAREFWEATGDIQQGTAGSGRESARLRIEGGSKFMNILQTPLVQVLIALVVVGVLLWLVNTFIPMAGSIKTLLNAVVIIVVVVWLLNIFGLMHYITNFHINRVG